MAHGREGPDIVMDIRYAALREIRAVSNHELYRTPDGASAIDPERSPLNKVLHGPRTQTEAVEGMLAGGVKPPAAQAEKPFVQIVLSASSQFFRDDPEALGTWNAVTLEPWIRGTMRWLWEEYGEDLAHVTLHLDEDTPHMHVLIVPTYEKKPRKPGRQKCGETAEEFEARKRAAESAETVRTISRSMNEYWKRQWCRREARVSYHAAMAPLGLGYGKDFVGSGDVSPERKETGQWVREQAAKVKKDRAALDVECKKLVDQRAEFYAAALARTENIKKDRDHLDAQSAALDVERAALDKRESKIESREEEVAAREEKFKGIMNRILPRLQNLVAFVGARLGHSPARTIEESLRRIEVDFDNYFAARSPADPSDQEESPTPDVFC